MRSLLHALLLVLSLHLAAAAPTLQNNPLEDRGAPNYQLVNLRIEGLTKTIYEGPILSSPRNITTGSGGTHPCTSENNGANPTTALDAASRLARFTYDGTYADAFEDFFITRIGPDALTATQFWGLLVDEQFTPTGGCQFATNTGDRVLWAFDAFSKQFFLRLKAPRTAKKGVPFEVVVTDGQSQAPVAGASVGGATTGSDGKAMVTVGEKGLVMLKAEEPRSVRSNRVEILVL